MTTSLVFYGLLGIASTVAAFAVNRRLFSGAQAGPVSLLEGVGGFMGSLQRLSE